MTEERALKLFAQAYNNGDFSKVVGRLHTRATYEAHDRFYRCTGKDKVAAVLGEKADILNALADRYRAYTGFIQVKHDVIGTRMESCVVLTGSDPRDVKGLVRIKCTPLHIKDILIKNPKDHTYTRADYAK